LDGILGLKDRQDDKTIYGDSILKKFQHMGLIVSFVLNGGCRWHTQTWFIIPIWVNDGLRRGFGKKRKASFDYW
jgi:hypothetical protein